MNDEVEIVNYDIEDEDKMGIQKKLTPADPEAFSYLVKLGTIQQLCADKVIGEWLCRKLLDQIKKG